MGAPCRRKPPSSRRDQRQEGQDVMAQLAFDEVGEPIDLPPATMGWRIRHMKGTRGAPGLVYGSEGGRSWSRWRWTSRSSAARWDSPGGTDSRPSTILGALRGLPAEPLLELAMARLRAALPPGSNVPTTSPIRFQLVPLQHVGHSK